MNTKTIITVLFSNGKTNRTNQNNSLSKTALKYFYD
jgi:hypothetical protein